MTSPRPVAVVVQTHWDREWYFTHQTFIARLLTVWHQLKFEGLKAFHFFLLKNSSIARRISSATESPVCFANSCSFAIDGSVR